MTCKSSVGFLAGAFLATGVWASDINQLQNLAQGEFKAFAKDLTGALSYKAVAPATPLGITGFDVSLGLSGTRMKHSDLWQKASGYGLSTLPVPKLQVTKGLPFGIDLGGFYTAVPTTNIRLWGAEVKYALLEGSMLTPAVAVRGSFTQLDGVDQLAFDTQGLELLVSKGFAGVTPYGGVGVVRSRAKARLTPLTLAPESNTATKLFAGLNWNVLLGNLALEVDRTGDNNTLSAKVGIRW